MFKSVVLKTMVFSTLVCVLIFILCSEAQEEEDIPCVYIGDNSTWPKQLLDDLEACKKDPGEAQTDQTLNRKQEKNKKFLKNFWNKLLKRISKVDRAKILECMWARQNIYDVEEDVIDWDEVDNLINSLKISAERKDSLKAAVEECIEDNDEDEINKLKKMSKCFIKEKCTVAACPELKRKKKNNPLCKSKGYKKNNNNETPTNDNDGDNNENEGDNNDNEGDNNDNDDDNDDNDENSTAGGDENIEETTVYNADETTEYDGDDATSVNVHYDH